MATLGENNLGIADMVTRQGPSGEFEGIVEMLKEINTLSTDAAWEESALPGSMQVITRVSNPTFTTLQPNGEGTGSKSTTNRSLESPEVIDRWINLHEEVANYGGDPAKAIASEMPAFVEGALQTVNDRLIYGNAATTVGQVDGLGRRFNSSTATNGRNVILGGALAGQTDCMSIYLIDHGIGKFNCWYPKGTRAGLEIKNLGLVPVTSSTGHSMRYQVQFKQSFGIKLADWRAVARICNIDRSLLIAGTGADLPFRMNQATHCMMRGVSMGRKAFYMNRTTFLYLDDQSRNDVQSGGQLGYVQVAGQEMDAWRGIPINIFDTLTESETVVS